MALDERDPHTGYMTTGHEWNGIKELNTPVPRVVYFFLIVTALFSVIYWVLMPAWPLGLTYTKGLLGIDQRTTVTESLKRAASEREAWTRRIGTESYQAIQNDPKLMTIVRQTGRTLFGDNCAACHGFDAKGGKGFPNLTTASWLWGGDPETIAETIRVGINSAHPNTRVGADARLWARPDTTAHRCGQRGRLRPVPVRPGGIEADLHRRSWKRARRSSPPTAPRATVTTARENLRSAHRT